MLIEKIEKLIQEATESDRVPLHGYIGSFVWSPEVKKNLDPASIWQIQHANEHNPHELKDIYINRKTGIPTDEKSIQKLNEFLVRYRN